MINLAIAILAATITTLLMGSFGLQVTYWISVPFGIIVGFVAFLLLGRQMQQKMESLMNQMQRELQNPKGDQNKKIDRAIEILKQGYVYKHRQLFMASQLNSQIGMLLYMKKDYDNAFEYLRKGFFKHYIGQCMLAIIHYKREDFDAMHKSMDQAISSNKKESICYGLYAWLLVQLKDKDKAVDILQQGLKKLPKDERLQTNLNLLQNNKKLKMKVYDQLWHQFMLERPPRMMQEGPQHQRMSRKAMFRGR